MSITVGELRDRLRGYSDDTEITFGANVFGVPLVFYRVKARGEKLVQIELSENFDVLGRYSVTYDGGSFLIEETPKEYRRRVNVPSSSTE